MASLHERKATTSEKKALKKKDDVAFMKGKMEEGNGEPVLSVTVDSLPEFKEVMDAYCHEYRDVAEQIKKLEERRKELAEVVLELVKESTFDSITGDNYHVVRVVQTRRSLSETKLVELGVDPDVIDKAKTKTTSEYVQVRAYEANPIAE